MVTLLTTVMREDESMRVTPSAMLTDLITGKPREVDIYVETDVTGHKVTVGIECRDWKRPQTVEWVEAMHAKHNHLPVNVTVLVSSSGFATTAIKLAEHYDIKTITPGEVTPGFVGTVVNNLDSIVTKRAAFRVKYVRFTVRWPDGSEKDVDATADAAVYTPDGTEIGTAADVVRLIVDNDEANRAGIRDTTGNEKTMTIRTSAPGFRGQPICIVPSLREQQLPLAPIVGVAIKGPVDIDVVEVPLTHGTYDGTPYSSGTAPLRDMQIRFVATESADGTIKWAGSSAKSKR